MSLAERKDYRFLVRAVFRVSGNKWHTSMPGDNPAWPLDASKIKYRIVAREVKVQEDDAENGGKMIWLEDNVQDGINVRKVYVFVSDLSNIDANYFKIDY